MFGKIAFWIFDVTNWAANFFTDLLMFFIDNWVLITLAVTVTVVVGFVLDLIS